MAATVTLMSPTIPSRKAQWVGPIRLVTVGGFRDTWRSASSDVAHVAAIGITCTRLAASKGFVWPRAIAGQREKNINFKTQIPAAETWTYHAGR